MIVFDWDGTLMDSAAQIVYCLQAAARDLNLNVPDAAQARHIIGLSLPLALQQLFPGCTADLQSELVAAYSRHYLADEGGGAQLFTGVAKMIDELIKSQQLITLATGKSRKGLDRVLQQVGWEQRFAATRCADESLSKPHPRMLEELLRWADCSPDQAVMVGDTQFDLEMAHRAGVEAWAVTWGAHDRQILEGMYPDRLFETVESLHHALMSF